MVIAERLHAIATREKVNIDTSALSVLTTAASGDLRRAVTLLQSAAVQFRAVSAAEACEVAEALPEAAAAALWDAARGGVPADVVRVVADFIADAHSVRAALLSVRAPGYTRACTSNALRGRAGYLGCVRVQLSGYLLRAGDVSDAARARFARSIATTEASLNRGADAEMQLAALLTQLV